MDGCSLQELGSLVPIPGRSEKLTKIKDCTSHMEVVTKSLRGVLFVRHILLPLAPPWSGRALCLRRAFTGRAAPEDDDDGRIAEARKWLASFTPDSIPQEYWEVFFARSSGPGRCY